MPMAARIDAIAAIEAAPIYLFTLDRDLRYTWVGRIPPELAPMLTNGVIGQTDEDLFGADQAAPFAAVKKQALETGSEVRTEVSIETPTGFAAFDVTVAPLRDEDGTVVGLSGAAFDITRYHEAASELRHAKERMADAEAVARFGSWEWDVERDAITWSPGLFHIYGITEDELDPQYAGRQRDQRVHPDDHARVERSVAGALETGRPFELDYRIVRPDGRVRIVHGRCEPVLNDAGKVVRMVGTAQDVTEVRLAEDALEESAAELARRAAQLHGLTHGDGQPPLDSILSSRQLEILELIAEGLSNFEIAERLFIAESTVKWHVRQILQKLEVTNRAQAVARLGQQN